MRFNPAIWRNYVDAALQRAARTAVRFAAWCQRTGSNIRLGASLHALRRDAENRAAIAGREYGNECELVSRLHRDELDEAERNARTPSAASQRLAVLIDRASGRLVALQKRTPLRRVK